MNLFWFRKDLRLHDNPGLLSAAEKPLRCIYILEDHPALRPLGGAARWYLHYSLYQLDQDLKKIGGRLDLYRGDPLEILPDLVQSGAVERVTWNRRYEKHAIAIDQQLKRSLDRTIEVESFAAFLLIEPWQCLTQSQHYYKVFTPFWRAARAKLLAVNPVHAPSHLSFAPPIDHAQRVCLDELELLPRRPNWAKTFVSFQAPGEAKALIRLQEFLDQRLVHYPKGRDRPAAHAVSGLASALAFGEISPRQIFAATQFHCQKFPSLQNAADKFLSEIGWREFCWHLLYHFPDLPQKPFNAGFFDMAWDEREDELLTIWQKGLTGYPIVDAGMRQLWSSGFMHNRVRMIVASFLTKHLLKDWRLGEAWFWDTLCDADPANNAANWQWVAGCGADAAPYFRIFNPILQGEKFDPDGTYVKQWVPELALLPKAFVHKPWLAPNEVLENSSLFLGKTYPIAAIDHAQARHNALAAYQSMKKLHAL